MLLAYTHIAMAMKKLRAMVVVTMIKILQMETILGTSSVIIKICVRFSISGTHKLSWFDEWLRDIGDRGRLSLDYPTNPLNTIILHFLFTLVFNSPSSINIVIVFFYKSINVYRDLLSTICNQFSALCLPNIVVACA